jgi:hypothetical protein
MGAMIHRSAGGDALTKFNSFSFSKPTDCNPWASGFKARQSLFAGRVELWRRSFARFFFTAMLKSSMPSEKAMAK